MLTFSPRSPRLINSGQQQKDSKSKLFSPPKNKIIGYKRPNYGKL